MPVLQHEFRIATNGLMLGLALLEGILAIWSSVLCCAGMCCCRRQQQVQQQGVSQMATYYILLAQIKCHGK